MKKIVIVIEKMLLGGTEKALLSMLKALPKNKYKVTLLLMSEGGDLYKDIPEWIDIQIMPFATLGSSKIIRKYIKLGNFFQVCRSLKYLSLIRYKSYYDQYLYKSKIIPKLEGEYDLAISYYGPCEFPDWYTINNIKAKKKAVWVHSDISKFKGIINSQSCFDMYSKYDKIYCVSKDASNSFKKVFPKLANKVEVFYNILSKEEIQNNGNSENVFDNDYEGIKILTVGRLSEEKGQLLIPRVLSKIKKSGFKVKWYCVGEGSLRKELENEIVKRDLTEDLILLGNHKNPYPYFKQCDLYVQTSRFEGYCLTLAEARCFNKPIVTTDFIGAKEQIIDGETGFIVNFSEDELYIKISELLVNERLREKFQSNLKKLELDTYKELEKLHRLIG